MVRPRLAGPAARPDDALRRQHRPDDWRGRDELFRQTLARHVAAGRLDDHVVHRRLEGIPARFDSLGHRGGRLRSRLPRAADRRAGCVHAGAPQLPGQEAAAAALPAAADGAADHLWHSAGDRALQAPARRNDLRRHPRQPHSRGAVRNPRHDPVHRANRSKPRVGGTRLRCQYWAHVLAHPRAVAGTGHSRRIAAGAGADDRAVRAHLPHRGPRFADAGRRVVLRRVRRWRTRAAVGRLDGNGLYGGDAGVTAHRSALRESHATRVSRQGTSTTSRMSRLSLGTLPALPATVARPTYDPSSIDVGIVHLGIGAFHRAQTAVYSDDALALEPARWGICGVSLRSADVRDRLSPQDGLYTAVEKSRAGVVRRVIGSVREVLFLGDQREAIHIRLAAPATRIVSLTITEKGYCHDPATGALNFTHPDIEHDLSHPGKPRSAIGLIVAALASRMRSGAGGFTVLCCDNLPHNGALVRGLALEYAQAHDPALARWLQDNASFPSTMVDRIVPATTEADIAENEAVLGLHDAAPVIHEPFRQWAIEDDFVAGRPAWERAGAELVRDVAPFEAMKLRLLNGSHSAFAYLGFLAGHEFIYQVAAHEEFVAFMRRLMRDEVAPTLKLPPGVDVV